tara:strand:- start:191 stop:472 length:282 start_codon:yes stop_codon:yes gene_type:complete
MKLKSKSTLLENIITDLDEQLAAIPTHDFDGTPIEDSLHFDMLIDGVANISFSEDSGFRKHYPINRTIATLLVEDELYERNNQPNEEDLDVKQ